MMVNFDSLPPELVIACSSYLDVEDSYKLCQTSRVLYEILTSHLWSNLTIQLSNNNSDGKNLEFDQYAHPIFVYGPGERCPLAEVSRLALTKIQYFTLKVDSDVELRKIEEVSELLCESQLEYFHVEVRNPEKYLPVVFQSNRFRYISLGLRILDSLESTISLRSIIPEKLAYLELEGINSQHVGISQLLSFPSLQNIFIKGLVTIGENDIIESFPLTESLRSLEVYISSSQYASDFFQRLNLTNLTNLQIDDTVFNTLLELMRDSLEFSLPSLDHLNVLSYTVYKTVQQDEEKRQECMSIIEDHCPNLNHVIVKCSNFPALMVPVKSGGPSGDTRTPIPQSGYMQFANLMYSYSPNTRLMIS